MHTCRRTSPSASRWTGRRFDPDRLDIQWKLYGLARDYAESHGLEAIGEEVGHQVLDRWESVLSGLETDPMTSPTNSTGSPSTGCSTGTASATASSGATPDSPRWTSSTTTCGPTSSLARRVGLVRLTDDDEVLRGSFRATADDAGVLPRHVPRPVRRRHRRRQLGLDRVRHRRCVPSAGSDDRAGQWDRGPRRRSARGGDVQRGPSRAARPLTLLAPDRRRSGAFPHGPSGEDVGHRPAIGIYARSSGTPRYGGRDAEIVHGRT